MSEKFYSKDEIERILRRAIRSDSRYSEGLSESDLFKIASELNIDKNKVVEAIKDDVEYSEYEDARNIWLSKKKSEFKIHLISFLSVNTVAILANLLITGSIDFAIFLIIIWSLWLILDFQHSYFPKEYKIDEGARKLLNSKKWKNAFNNIGIRILESIQKK